jgi:hypothetical protein
MHKVLPIVICCLIPFSVFAQHGNSRYERVQAQKIAFFTERLQLTSSEAEKFWPVYNDYQNRKNKIANERRTLTQYFVENSENMSDKEISESLDKFIQLQKKETELLETYNEKFKQILPDEKVMKIYITEFQFKNWLLKQLRSNHPGRN